MSQPGTEEQQENKANEEELKEKVKKSAEDRIQELTRRNGELEKLVNMNQRLGNMEGAVQNIAAAVNRQPEKPKDEWHGFMEPKVKPIIEEALGPYKQALFGLADQNDKLHTMMAYPEYKDDPEIQQEVENIRQERQRQTGQVESRENVILYLRGRNPDKFAKKGGSKAAEKDEDEGRGQAVHVEKGSGVGSSRAASNVNQKTAEDATIEEMEKFMSDNKFSF